MLYMQLRRFRSMMGGMVGVPAGAVCVMGGCFVIAIFVMLCCLAMVLRRMVEVLCCLMVMLRCFFRHFGLQINVSTCYFGA
jgi:hypothetical protein